jgi:hypothetical protein
MERCDACTGLRREQCDNIYSSVVDIEKQGEALRLTGDDTAELLDENADSVRRTRTLAYSMFEAIGCELDAQAINSNIMELKG